MGKKKTASASKSSDEISIDFSSVKKFFTNMEVDWNKVLIALLILIPMLLAIHFRVHSAYLPVTEDWARNAVYNGVQNSIASQVNQQYPNLPVQNKQELVNQQFQQFLSQQGDQVEQQVQATAQHFRSQLQNDDGQTYLQAIDPYQWYRRINNWAETGHWWDELRNGQPWNNHMYAPVGIEMSQSMHMVFSYYIYQIVHLFSGLPFMTIFFYMPVIFAALSMIPAFFLARKKGGNVAGFAAATLLAVHTSFLGRTSAGFSDTDAYNVFFPLLITWVFLEAFESKKLSTKIILSSLAGALVGLFSYTWGGWWYIMDFLVVVLVAFFVYVIVKEIVNGNRNISRIATAVPVKNTLLVGGFFLVFSGIVVTLFSSFGAFISGFTEPLGFRVFKAAAHPSLWPNVFTTVAELGDTSIRTIVNSMGGKLMMFIAMLGLVMTMLGRKLAKRDIFLLGGSLIVLLLLISDSFLGMSPIKYLLLLAVPLAIGLFLSLKSDDVDVKYALFLTVWFAGTIYASTKGVRFLLLLIPAFSVAFGIAIGMLHRIFTGWASRETEFDNRLVSGIVAVLLLLLLVSPIQTAANVAKGEVPSMNDAWWQSLTEIKEASQPDAIINSWWDFGHWFKAIADRAVTFDGASQNTPMAHWIGRVLLSDDEDTSIGILRMLDCGSNTAFEKVNEITNDTVFSVKLLYDIVVMDEEEAKERLLSEGFNEEKALEILERTHCEPPENYFITSEDMIGKASVWAHFGAWDFEKAYIYTRLRNKGPQAAIQEMQDKFGYDEEKARSLYHEAVALPNENQANAWISPWPNYVTGSWSGCRNQSDVLVCSVGAGIGNQGNQRIVLEHVVINNTELNNSFVRFGVYDRNTNSRVGESIGVPDSFVFAGEEIERVRMEGNIFPYDVLVDTLNNRVLILHPMFSESLFTKLFYLDGRYTDHFGKFSDRQGVNGQRIVVWKVDWEGKVD